MTEKTANYNILLCMGTGDFFLYSLFFFCFVCVLLLSLRFVLYNNNATIATIRLFPHHNPITHPQPSCMEFDIVCLNMDALSHLSTGHDRNNAVIASVTKQKEKEGTCYAHAAAGVVLAALMRRVGSALPPMMSVVDEAIAIGRQHDLRKGKSANGLNGGSTDVLVELCAKYRLHAQQVTYLQAKHALVAGRSVYGTFLGGETFWNDIYSYDNGILGGLDVGGKDDGGHAVLVYNMQRGSTTMEFPILQHVTHGGKVGEKEWAMVSDFHLGQMPWSRQVAVFALALIFHGMPYGMCIFVFRIVLLPRKISTLRF